MEFLGPLWSLAIEEQFYIAWPLCVWSFSSARLMQICGLGTLIAFLLRWGLTPHATTALLSAIYMNPLTRMDALLVGAFCSICVRNVELLQRAQKAMPAIFVAAMSMLLLLVIAGERWNDYDVLVYGHLLLAIGFGCLVVWAYLRDGKGEPFDRFLRTRVLTVFGKYS
jgi:peptidoglycan/LPS O-acetylase OafA/YrhL